MKRFLLADQYEDIDNGWDVEANSWEEALAIGKAEGWRIVMWVELDQYSEWVGDIEFT